jgi:hypothetical protein
MVRPMRREGRYPDGFGVAPRLSKARNGAAWDIAIFEIAREAAVHTSEPVGSKLHDLCCGSAKAAQKHGEDRASTLVFHRLGSCHRKVAHSSSDAANATFVNWRKISIALIDGHRSSISALLASSTSRSAN